MATTPKIWLITGANTGIGHELALKALKEGDKVIAAVRSPAKLPKSLQNSNVYPLHYDLSWSSEQNEAVIEAAKALHGRIDVLVNMAAYSYMGAIEETNDEETKRQYDINVFGVLRTIRAILPLMRAQGSGTIVNVSSIGGLNAFPSNGIYCSTKYAIEGLTQALATEVEPFGIRVMVVEPGYTRTAFLEAVSNGINIAKPIAAYDGTAAHEASAAFSKYNGAQIGNSTLCGERIYEAITGTGLAKGKKLHLRLPLGSDTGSQMLALAKELTATAEDYEEIWRSTDYKD